MKSTLIPLITALGVAFAFGAQAQQKPVAAKKPNILVIFGDDIGVANVSAYSHGVVGYRTPNIDRIAKEGTMFTDYYAEQSCTAGRSAFITGIATLRTGLSKVGSPGATLGLQAKDPTIAELLKPLGYATGQFGKNHLGDRNEFLPTVHGFDEFFGNLYHLNRSPIRETQNSGSCWARAACCTPGQPTRTILPSSRASAASAGRESRTRARSPKSGWRPSTTRPPARRWISWSGR